MKASCAKTILSARLRLSEDYKLVRILTPCGYETREKWDWNTEGRERRCFKNFKRGELHKFVLVDDLDLKISIKDAKHSVSKRRDACVSYPSQARDGPITNVSRSLSLYVKPISGLKGSSLPPLRDTTIDGPSP